MDLVFVGGQMRTGLGQGSSSLGQQRMVVATQMFWGSKIGGLERVEQKANVRHQFLMEFR